MNDKLHYKEIADRCAEAARELCPESPEVNDIDSWQRYLDELNALDVYEVAREEVDWWDWCTYVRYGFEILDAMPSDEVNEAEIEWYELNAFSGKGPNFGPFEFASEVAFLLLSKRVREELEELISDLKELAEQKIEDLGG